MPTDHGTQLINDASYYRRADARGEPELRPMFSRLTPDGGVWPDGAAEAVDAVIFATGFRPRLAYLAGLGAVDGGGRVRQRGGVSTAVSGLYFVGLSGQRTFASATLRGVGPDAARVVRHLRRHLRRGGPPTCCG